MSVCSDKKNRNESKLSCEMDTSLPSAFNLKCTLKRHAMTNKCKLIMSFVTCIYVFNGLTLSCINISLDKCIRFGSCQTRWLCCKTFWGMTPPSVLVTSLQTGHRKVFYFLNVMSLIFTLLPLSH